MKILILAQIPPPYHGQSIMQQYLVNASWEWCEKQFIRLNFSKSIEEVGNFRLKKIVDAFRIILKVWKIRLNKDIDVLFYPPAGPNKVPFYRDILLLFFIRRCTRKIIFHFHSGGFDLLLSKLNPLQKFFALKVYNNPDAVIILSSYLKSEVHWIKPKELYIIPNGVEDYYSANSLANKDNEKPIILTAGIISEAKGIFISMEAARILKESNYKFTWNFIGEFKFSKIKKEAEKKILEYDLKENIKFLGKIDGEEKFKLYSLTDIFCFPSYENEGMPLVLLEAMMMSLSIVATNWRGIPDIIDNNINGLLVPIKDPQKLAEAIEKLINNREIRNNLALNARKKYLREFTIKKHLKRMEEVFKEVAFRS